MEQKGKNIVFTQLPLETLFSPPARFFILSRYSKGEVEVSNVCRHLQIDLTDRCIEVRLKYLH